MVQSTKPGQDVQQKVTAISSWCIAPARPNNIAAMIVEGTMMCKNNIILMILIQRVLRLVVMSSLHAAENGGDF